MADDDWIVPDAVKPPAPATGADDWVTTPHDHPEAPKPTFASRAAEPITSYPEEYKRQREGSAEMALSGVKGLWEGQRDEPNPVKAFGKDALNLGKTLAGALGYVASPISAGLTTTVGKPVEQATGSPFAGKMAETAAGLAIPGYGLTRTNIARYAVPAVPGPVTDAVAAARDALAKQNTEKARQFTDVHGRPIELSYGEAAQSRDAYHLEDMAEQGAYGKPAQDVATPIQRERFDVMHGAGEEIGQELGGRRPDVTNPEHAARVVNDEMRQHAERIAQTRQQLQHYANSQEQAQAGMVADQERELGDIIRGRGEEAGSARDTGEMVGNAVRQRAAAARTGVGQAYEHAFALPGEIHAGAFEGVGTRIKGDLTFHNDPVIIDDVTTPVASRAIQHLDKSIDQLRIQNRADPMGQPNPENITAVNLRGVDQLRKQLNKFYAAARGGQNPSDARAMGRIIDAFDNQVESAVAGNLFSGDPRALQALRDARAAYRNYTQTFRPQGAGDDVGQAMRRIIDRGATPDEVANMVLGSSATGNPGLPVRLAARLEQIFGRESQEWSAVRQSLWQRASTGAQNAQKAAERIEQFANSTLGRQMFRPEELAAMRNHAQGVRTLEQTISTLPARQHAERFAQGYERFFSGKEIGGPPGQTLRKIAEGRAEPEEIINTVFKAIGSGRSGEASRMVDAIGAIAGRESPAFDALRQGSWQTITKRAPGADKIGPQKLSQDILQFVGSPVARKLYSPDELKRMREYAEVVKLKAPQPKSKVTPAGTAPSLAIMARRVLTTHALPVAVNATVGHIPLAGPFIAHGVNGALAKFSTAAEEAAQAAKVKRSLEGLSPDVPKSPRQPLRFTIGMDRTSPGVGTAANAFPSDDTQRARGGRAMADGGAPDEEVPEEPAFVPRKMTMEEPPVIGNRPDVQEGVKAVGRDVVEPFGQLGKVMTGASEAPLQDLATAAIGAVGPPGVRALRGPLKAGEEALARTATKPHGGVEAPWTGSFNPLDEAKFTWKGKEPHEWSPQDYQEAGKHFSVENLGPASPPQEFVDVTGKPFTIPGGLEGKFTYHDLLSMKAQGIDPSKIDRDLHTKIQQKIMRTMDPGERASDEQIWSGLIFGLTSPNNPLFPNQLTQSRLRMRDPKMIDQLANMISWGPGEAVGVKERQAASDQIANAFGLGAAAKGGLGTRGSQDYTRVAELAKMFQEDPSFFRKDKGESWTDFVERVSSQVAGLQMKTGSFGSVWQDPANAAISAIDRHMAQQFERTGGLFRDEAERFDWEKRAVSRWNKTNPDRKVDNFYQMRQTPGTDGHIGKMLLEYVGNAEEKKFRTAKGEINKSAPEHLAKANWVVEPQKYLQMGEAYKRALDINDKIAKEHGLGLFASQWMEWDRIRRRLEPHENMFPGLERMPAMSRDQLRLVDAEHAASGHKNYTKVDPSGRPIKEVPEEERAETQTFLQPTKPRPKAAPFGYFGIPAAAALGEGVVQKNREQRASGGRVSLRTRRESNYSPTGGTPDHHCGPDRKWPVGFCAKFRGPHSCTEVGGFITAHGHCDWYERAPEGRASGGRVLGHYVDLNPTEAQKAAGNYRKAHITVHGLGIAIENPKGTQRHGVGHDGKAWATRVPAHYGYIKGFIGRDKDHVDVYVGPYAKSKRAWVVEQHDEKSGRFDEHKVFLGFASEGHVRKTYDAGFSDGRGPERRGRIHEMSVDQLKEWLHSLRYKKAS